MQDETYKKWDLALKIMAIFGSALAIYTYFDKKEVEFRKPLWDEQLKLYFDAADTASRVANLPEGSAERDAAILKFWELYYGPLRVVEDDKNVGSAMFAFGTCVREKCNQTTLQNKSLDVADACARSIAETWNQKFADYKALVDKRIEPQDNGKKQ
jgi:hypothetical protein